MTVPPRTIHQMRKSALVWAPSVRFVRNATPEELEEAFDIDPEHPKCVEVRERLEKALKECGKL